MRWTILTIGVTLVLTALATTAAADDLASVSGECYSEDYSEGGSAYIAVTDGAQVQENGIITDGNTIDPAQPGGAVDALSYFAVRSAQSSPGEACDGPSPDEDPDRENDDYLAVTVLGVMVCYDGAPNVWANQGAWGCPTRPGGIPDS